MKIGQLVWHTSQNRTSLLLVRLKYVKVIIAKCAQLSICAYTGQGTLSIKIATGGWWTV